MRAARSGHSIRCTASHLLCGREGSDQSVEPSCFRNCFTVGKVVVMQSNGRGSQTSEGDLCLQSCIMWVGHADGRDICIRYKMTTERTDALVSISRRNCQWVEMFVALKLSQASLWPAENKLSMHIYLMKKLRTFLALSSV